MRSQAETDLAKGAKQPAARSSAATLIKVGEGKEWCCFGGISQQNKFLVAQHLLSLIFILQHSQCLPSHIHPRTAAGQGGKNDLGLHCCTEGLKLN